MNILITGANGQLGQCLHDVYEQDLTHLNNWFFVSREQLDIANRVDVEDYINKCKIDIVINCAAYTNVEAAEDKLDNAYSANVLGPQNLAYALKERNGILIHISTDYVYAPYNSWDGYPFKEDFDAFSMGVSPFNYYGVTKLSGEMAIKSTGCRNLIIRTSWLYSVYGKNFVKTVRDLIKKSSFDKELKFVCDQIGSPTSAHNLAAFIYNMAYGLGIRNDLFQNFTSDIINYSDDGACSWYDFAFQINQSLKKIRTIKPCYSSDYPTKAKRPGYSVMSKEKIKTEDRYIMYTNTRDWRACVDEVVRRLELDDERNNTSWRGGL